MLKLSKKSEYALRALLTIARNPAQLHTIPQISQNSDVPPKFLEQILLSLRHAGILESRRGAGGGYMLSRNPASIRLLEAIEAVEGKNLLLTEKMDDAVGKYFHELAQDLLKKFNSTTLEDLLILESNLAAGNYEI
ncbi:MAG: Rrf2 family transcriptional regulator [Chthoniobacterales bacterium]|nr:Rrf2 family transcriptional regulator [Chthoniobacterales bacterium]MCX7713692.1 Rrf2 family transcriptional regulator [Chthoniobacterales bacterium]